MSRDVYATVDHFLAGLAAAGVTDIVASPGMRSTPLVLTADRRPDLAIRMVLDERAAAFMALGMAKATRRPVGLICTSGTAGANYLPAIVEARLTRVPLVVMTSDRPPELQGWDAGQTVDQVKMYGDHVVEFVGMPVGPLETGRAERIGFRVAVTARADLAGPVHVNWPFREPLEPDAIWLSDSPPATSRLRVSLPQPRSGGSDLLAEVVGRHERGLLAVGPLAADETTCAAIADLAVAAGWPIVADPLAQMRTPLRPNVLSTADHLFRATEWADRHPADAVVRIGGMPTSKAFRLWMERHRPERVVLVDSDQRWSDPGAIFTDVIHADPGRLCEAAIARVTPRRSEWPAMWAAADNRVSELIESELTSQPLAEPGATRAVVEAIEPGSVLFAASSMPIRNLDGFMPSADITVMANRGANGIDGTIATAAGALAGFDAPGLLLIGDLALLHDLGGLRAAADAKVDLTIVVLDNNGGGIFSMLPIADLAGMIDFETLYRTPHDSSIAAAARLVGVDAVTATDASEIGAAVRTAQASGGLHMIVVPIDRDTNVAQFRKLAVRVAEVLA